MSENIEKIKAAPFLVSSSQQRDFTTIVAPDYICDANISDLLRKVVSRYNQPTESGKAILIEISDSEVGTIYVVFRTVWALEEYIGNQGNEVLRDPARPIPFIEGFLLKKPIASDVISPTNFEIAHQQVVNFYQAFWQSPQPVQKSESFDLQTDTDTSNNLVLFKTQFSSLGRISRDKSWRCISTLIPDGDPSGVCSVAFSPDGKLIAARYINQTVRLWDWGKQKIEFAWDFGKSESVSSIAFSPNGRTIATAVLNPSGENVIKLFTLQKSESKNLSKNIRQAISSIAFRYDSEWLVSGSEDRTLKLWHLPKTSYHCDFQETGGLIRGNYDPHLHPIKAVAISPDGMLLISGDDSGYIKTRGMERFADSRDKVRASLIAINSLAFSPNGQIVASGSSDGKIKFFKSKNLENIQSIEVSSSINSVAFSPSGKILASGSDDGRIRICDVEKNELLLTIDEHKKEVMTVAFSTDGLLVSGSKDGEIKIWREGW